MAQITDGPGPATRTARQAMTQLMTGRALSGRQLAEALLLPRDEVERHLEHLRRSLDGRLRMIPAHCLLCGYRFDERKRLDAPGKCPRCRGQKIDGPWFRLDD